MPEGEDWTIIDDLVHILHPFQQATEAMCTDKYSTISTVKPLLYKLLSKTLEAQDDDSTTLRDMKMAVKSDLSRRYQKDDVKDVMNRVTFLDPRYKELPFLSDGEKSQVIEDVEVELCNLLSSEPDIESDIEAVDEPATKKPKISLMSQLLGDMFSSKTPDDQDQLHQVDKAKKELAQYNAESVPDLDIDPLEWWKVRQRTYPLLTKLVRKRFSMVATSVPSDKGYLAQLVM